MIRKMLQAILCITLCPLFVAQQAAPPVSVSTVTSGPIVLKKQAGVSLLLLEAVSSATATEGQSVRMAVKEDVSTGGVVVIPRGTPATGVVVRARKAVLGKKDGSVSIEPVSVNPANSNPIALRHYKYTLEDDGMCRGFLDCLPLIVAAPMYGVGDLIAYPFRKHHVAGEDEVLPACSEQWSVVARSILIQANGTTLLQPAHPGIDLDAVCSGGAKAFIS
jgi:hypothetical protein